MITLIIPPSSFLIDDRIFPSLGVLKVAAALEAAGVSVRVADFSGRPDIDCIPPADVYGITATMPQMPAAIRIAERIRKESPDAKIILGGPHVTLMQASARIEAQKGISGRASLAMQQLHERFAVLVAGDGERAILEALKPDAPAMIDGDDQNSALFLKSADLNASPLPARHLIDIASYRYEIDGIPTQSLIAQLGCLAAGTSIMLASGEAVPIETVRRGDLVVSWDEKIQGFTSKPVVATWSRMAPDLWEVLFDDGSELLATSEHPVWTQSGWKKIEETQVSVDSVASMSPVRKASTAASESHLQPRVLRAVTSERNIQNLPDLSGEFLFSPHLYSPSELLFVQMQKRMAEKSRESELVEVGPACDESPMGSYVPRGTISEQQYKNIAESSKNETSTKDFFGNKARRFESDETRGSVRKSIQYDKDQVGSLLVGTDKAIMARGSDQALVGISANRSIAEQAREDIGGTLDSRSAAVSLGRESSILGRPLSGRKAPQPRLRRFKSQEGNIASRRALAQRGIGVGGDCGLSVLQMASPSNLDERIAPEESGNSYAKNSPIRFRKIISKRFIGSSQVFNLTVCPGHSYLANNLIVHNCPFQCSFCGGRRSPFLRKVRTRDTVHVISEMRHLYERYGTRGFMFLDDELNVNKQFIELLMAIVVLQEELGVEFRLRGLIKSELLTTSQADWMYHAGFRQLLIGFESGSERILYNIQKKATVEDNTRCVELLRKHGIRVKALMSIGHAGESEETVKATRDWLLKVQPNDFDVTIITVYPGTPYWDDAVERLPGVWTYTAKNGDRLHALTVDQLKDVNFYKGMPGQYQSFVYTDSLTENELVQLRDQTEDECRKALSIPYPSSPAELQYEHSMAQR